MLPGWLKQHQGIKVLAQYGNASQITSSDTIEKTHAVLNQYRNMDAFWVTWDEFAQGVVQAEVQRNKHRDGREACEHVSDRRGWAAQSSA